jgi:hypothetical protein
VTRDEIGEIVNDIPALKNVALLHASALRNAKVFSSPDIWTVVLEALHETWELLCEAEVSASENSNGTRRI